jgi:hypothetical protein
VTRKKGRSSTGGTIARGVADPGRLTHPGADPEGKAEESTRDHPQSAPMHGTPLPERELERLKERAKSSPLPKGTPSQEDPSTKK